MQVIDEDHRQRQEEMSALDKSIKNKKDALNRRIDRMKRQQEIAEAAANEKKDSNELKMQENFMAQKFWSSFLKTKMDKEMKRTSQFEKAFQEIRAATGYSDVQDIVQKFLTREQTYAQLLYSVGEQEEKIDGLRQDNEIWLEKLQDLQIHQAELNVATNRSTSSFAPELNQLDNKMQELTKKADVASNVAKKVQLVDDQVSGWCSRVIQKLDQQFNENIGAYTEKSMAFKFEQIMLAVNKQLDQILMEDDDNEDRGFITAKDFMNDFATEDFISKNIRVRPVSGITRAAENEETKTAGAEVSKGDGNVESEEKFNDDIRFELEKDRKLAKDRKREFEKRKAMEEELIRKKNARF